ncbi:hypothetical protein QIH03_27520, partial [Klebsiella pneumoniae]|nr:hypothetical protein [Klebsiella pneumoniae]
MNSRDNPAFIGGWTQEAYIDGRLQRLPDSMRFTPQFLEELRARLPVSEVVGKRVKLKRAGKEYKG